MKALTICTHKYTYLPDDALIEYLRSNKYDCVMHVIHSFHDAPDRKSYFRVYVKGELTKDISTLDFRKLPEPVIYLKELFYTLKWLIFSGSKFDKYIGMDGMCVFFGLLLRIIGRVDKVIFWAIDFVPADRFKGGLKNKLYHLINTVGYKNADEMWDLSPRMAEAREKFLGIKESDYKLRKVVPFGVWLERIKTYSYDACEKNTLVFIGNLIEKQGVQEVIKIIPKIVVQLPEFYFKIIGTGSYEKSLKRLALETNVADRCNFMGSVPDHKVLEDEVAKSCLAIAPYIKELDTWTYYADPGKVKVYLGCGVPVLLTDIVWHASLIEKEGAGKVVELKDLAEEILLFMKSERNSIARARARSYAESFSYTNIFKELGL